MATFWSPVLSHRGVKCPSFVLWQTSSFMDGQEVNVRIVGESLIPIFWQMESETAIIVQTQKGQEPRVLPWQQHGVRHCV